MCSDKLQHLLRPIVWGAPHHVYDASSRKVNKTQMASPVEARTQIWDNRNNLSLTQCSKSQTCMFF